ncbi:MAG: GNAT family N-acetyltransferase [Acidimicrobiales bacterium]
MTDLDLVDLDPGDGRLVAEVLPVLRELRPHLTVETFEAVCAEGRPQGLRFTAAYHGGTCVGVAGWRIVATTATLRKLYVDDLVTTADTRSTGVGRTLLGALAQRAEAAGCTALDLDSAVHRADAHRFYMREGLTIGAFHFGRLLR